MSSKVVLVTGSNKKKFFLNMGSSNVYCVYPVHDYTGEYSKAVLVDGRELILNETIEEINQQLKEL